MGQAWDESHLTHIITNSRSNVKPFSRLFNDLRLVATNAAPRHMGSRLCDTQPQRGQGPRRVAPGGQGARTRKHPAAPGGAAGLVATNKML